MSSTIQAIKEYSRGTIGGLLFSLPIVYTMEVWWTGFTAPPEKLIVFVLATFLLLLGYNRFAGMHKDHSFLEICRDSVEEIGVAFVVTFLFLLLIHRVGFGMSTYEILGKTIVECMIVAIGISVGTAQLGQEEEKSSGTDKDEEKERENVNGEYLQLAILSICGAVLISSSVAPTDEILMIAVGSSTLHLICMVVVSLLLSWVTLFYSDFHGSAQGKSDISRMFAHVIMGYVAALLVATGFLWFFGRLYGVGFQIAIAQIVVLGIPAAIGASAGRLLLRGEN